MPDGPPIPEGHMRCAFCWETFESPVALLEHEALEDDRLYEVDGLTNQAPAASCSPSGWNSTSHRSTSRGPIAQPSKVQGRPMERLQ